MDADYKKKLKKEFSKLYALALPRLAEFEKERLNASYTPELNKLFQEKVKWFYLEELQDIFGIKKWTNAKQEDTDYIINLIKTTQIQDFYHTRSTNNQDFDILNHEICEIITGEYQGINYKIYDMHENILLELPSNKKFSKTTRLYSKQVIYKQMLMGICLLLCALLCHWFVFQYLIGYIGMGITLFATLKALLIINQSYELFNDRNNLLEDVEFSKKYYLFSTDPVEARYLVTTAFMERFKKLEKKLKTERIQCIFHEGKIILAIKSKTNRFEIADLRKRVDSPTLFKKFFYEFTAIMDIIDLFKFDEEIGL